MGSFCRNIFIIHRYHISLSSEREKQISILIWVGHWMWIDSGVTKQISHLLAVVILQYSLYKPKNRVPKTILKHEHEDGHIYYMHRIWICSILSKRFKHQQLYISVWLVLQSTYNTGNCVAVEAIRSRKKNTFVSSSSSSIDCCLLFVKECS